MVSLKKKKPNSNNLEIHPCSLSIWEAEEGWPKEQFEWHSMSSQPKQYN